LVLTVNSSPDPSSESKTKSIKKCLSEIISIINIY